MTLSTLPIIIVPARLASVRFPKKLLANAGGKPLIIRTAERIRSEAPEFDLFFAVDGEELKKLLEDAGYNAILTSPDLPSGTDRIAKANQELKREFVINVQADEPLVTRTHILSLARSISKAGVSISTLASVFLTESDFFDPNQVKVVLDNEGNALYFSRSPIPFSQAKKLDCGNEKTAQGYKHMGLYAYNSEFLDFFLDSKESALERIEKLEQLRALQNGYKIAVEIVDETTIGIDVPADLEKIKFE
jgi:3-deoxy-manno-octulosonate cytidylyltransferase (CMP-KDO synthetase)